MGPKTLLKLLRPYIEKAETHGRNKKTLAAMAHNAAAAFVSSFSLIALGLLLKRCNIVQDGAWGLGLRMRATCSCCLPIGRSTRFVV